MYEESLGCINSKSIKREKPAQKKWRLVVCCGSTPAGHEDSPSDSEMCLQSRYPDAHSAWTSDCRHNSITFIVNSMITAEIILKIKMKKHAVFHH